MVLAGLTRRGRASSAVERLFIYLMAAGGAAFCAAGQLPLSRAALSCDRSRPAAVCAASVTRSSLTQILTVPAVDGWRAPRCSRHPGRQFTRWTRMTAPRACPDLFGPLIHLRFHRASLVPATRWPSVLLTELRNAPRSRGLLNHRPRVGATTTTTARRLPSRRLREQSAAFYTGTSSSSRCSATLDRRNLQAARREDSPGSSSSRGLRLQGGGLWITDFHGDDETRARPQ